MSPTTYLPSVHFNPRTPCGVRRMVLLTIVNRCLFQSTHPLRGATTDFTGDYDNSGISIHAPLAGCDHSSGSLRRRVRHFNPRTPCGVRPSARCPYSGEVVFQSTHPLRGATDKFGHTGKTAEISIHAPLAGCDAAYCVAYSFNTSFQSTHPLRGATLHGARLSVCVSISIHAPLAGCDMHAPPRSRRARGFQSTHPLRGATRPACSRSGQTQISIHAPLAGCDTRQ